jgi:hypothetical protein
MKSTASKTVPHHLHEELHRWETSVTAGLDALRSPVRKHPIKFMVLSCWTAFFIGLVVKG